MDNFTRMEITISLGEDSQAVCLGNSQQVGRAGPVPRLDHRQGGAGRRLPRIARGVIRRPVPFLNESTAQPGPDRFVSGNWMPREKPQCRADEQEEPDKAADRVAGKTEDERARTVPAPGTDAEPEWLAWLERTL